MAITFGNTTQIIEVLKEYLKEAEADGFDAIAIAGYSNQHHTKNIVITPGTNGVGLIGNLVQLLSELSATCASIEHTNANTIQEAFESLPTTPGTEN